ncbi:glyoxalase [Vibrio paucivorans]|uniref:Glyoxalase n=1 Tax=Vibrio paucivorans TaxID=2829489 RepID=A0A9X3CJA5_9VIBR|nr:glyoxalase [Vibrio paucivorans]MCW8336554.1 glyoxalase [Vibrio paucivorans]
MFKIDSIVLYVTEVKASSAFYAQLFDCTAEMLSPSFAVIEFASNVKVTLQQIDSLTPTSVVTGGGTELSIPVESKAVLEKIYRSWLLKGIEFAQLPEESVFGINFVALDPDGHRIRVFAG